MSRPEVIEGPYEDHAKMERGPYKGSSSYEPWDEALFFGRNAESEHLIAKILANRFTVLHAQSGAGKTSLLNARIIPGLERKGWGALRVRPQDDPLYSIRRATLQYVAPPLESELAALDAAARVLSCDEACLLQDLFKKYDAMCLADERKRDLGGTQPIPDDLRSVYGVQEVTPKFALLLRATLAESDYGEHVNVFHEESVQISSETTIGELRSLLESQPARLNHKRLLMNMSQPSRTLTDFVKRLLKSYGPQLKLVWILDQFEEIFTRFVELPKGREGQSDSPEWSLKYRLFDEIGELYNERLGPDSGAESDVAPSWLPIRFVISLRDEYVAQLDPARNYVWSIEENFFHLTLLRKDQAAAAIRNPARIYGYGYDETCYSEIIRDLTKEGRFVEPAHIQIVCDKLWRQQGKDLAQSAQEPASDAESLPAIRFDVLQELKGAQGILDDFFREFLQGVANENDRLEVLDILDQLVTPYGTRNIVSERILVEAPYRVRRRRNELLELMRDKTILRAEWRLDERFVEITHEFLINPVRTAVKDGLQQGDSWMFVAAREKLIAADLSLDTHAKFKVEDFEVLLSEPNRISWDQRGSEVMLRVALGLGSSIERIRQGLGLYRQFDASVAGIVQVMARYDRRTPLNYPEYCALDSARPDTELSPAQLDVALRSALRWSEVPRRESLEYWLRRYMDGQ